MFGKVEKIGAICENSGKYAKIVENSENMCKNSRK